GRVAQVALPARHRQLVGEVAEQGAGDAEVALGVLEVDRVYLVRHGRGADLGVPDAQPEVAQGDVVPHVPAQVEEHGRAAGRRVQVLRHPVVRLDQRRERVGGEAQRLYEPAAQVRPVDPGTR